VMGRWMAVARRYVRAAAACSGDGSMDGGGSALREGGVDGIEDDVHPLPPRDTPGDQVTGRRQLRARGVRRQCHDGAGEPSPAA
jgi:hypothetical protein